VTPAAGGGVATPPSQRAEPPGAASDPAADALAAALLLAASVWRPGAAGGVAGAVVRAAAGPVRDAWLATLRALLPPAAPWRRLPSSIGDERVLGGLDLAATLAAGRPVGMAGVLAECDGGVLVVPMAERLEPGTAARLGAAIDTAEVMPVRGGAAAPARLVVLAFDEGEGDDPPPPRVLADRLPLMLTLPPAGRELASLLADDGWRREAAAALAAWADTANDTGSDAGAPPSAVEALAAASLAFGVPGLRAPIAACAAAARHAALAGRAEVEVEDSALALRLVLLPRATRWPAPGDAAADAPADEAAPETEPTPPPPPAPPGPEPEAPPAPPAPEAANDETPPAPAEAAPPPAPEAPLPDQLLAAVLASLPAGLLARLQAAEAARRARAGRSAKAGAAQPRAAASRGRPSGARPGTPRRGERLDLVATLRAAVPWQPLRGAGPAPPAAGAAAGRRRVAVRPADFHVRRRRPRRGTTAIFVVDASGSAAMHRLAEAKGAVERLLLDCYVRRDRVAVISFRGAGAEVLLPPTRSLARARRELAGLPGGGGTPLAAAIDAARELSAQVGREGDAALVVLLTDGRANVALGGLGGRAAAEADALAAAARFRAEALRSAAIVSALVIDTSPQPRPHAALVAQAMGAACIVLPHAAGDEVAGVVRARIG
jgi:magnesium chelatase subunit D